MIDLKATGNFIAECRREKQLTQKQLGEKLNVTDRAVSKWETGKSFPDVSLLESLCRELDISVSELLSGKRIQPEQYQEETEKLLTASISGGQLYGVQIVIYIMQIIDITIFFLPFLARQNRFLPDADLPNVLCWIAAAALLGCIAWLDKAMPGRMFRTSNIWLEGIFAGLYFLIYMSLVIFNSFSGDLTWDAVDAGEKVYVFLIFAAGMAAGIAVRIALARKRRANLEEQDKFQENGR